jgi:hypothetical protein
MKELRERKKIYYCPFSTTYNFDLDWLGGNVLYIYKIPVECNYLYLYDQKQYEVTLQQGEAHIIDIYHYYYNDRKIIVIMCDFIPISPDEITLPDNC